MSNRLICTIFRLGPARLRRHQNLEVALLISSTNHQEKLQLPLHIGLSDIAVLVYANCKYITVGELCEQRGIAQRA